MSSLTGKTVLITGGASGIGKIMSRLSLERKAKVIIWDIDQAKIQETLESLNHLGVISGFQTDLSNWEQTLQTALKTIEIHGRVDILINNAGVVTGKYFHEHTETEIERTMAVNSIAPMHITRFFLPDMLERNEGHICTIASSAGLISNPKMAVYAASKWAAAGWSDSVRLEMKRLGKNIGVTTIMPYYINTGMFDGVRSRIPILDPERAALTIIRSIEKNKTLVTIPGYIYRLTRISQGIFPLAVFDWVAGKVLGIYKTMDHFTGRK
ncbi:SDR family oxidoreductase [Fluviicola sp.]|uniref:SDR family oxidoreductase n=1 Tax=Fluviicola sp. TaxID=1917219 RepID=UPI0031DC96AE